MSASDQHGDKAADPLLPRAPTNLTLHGRAMRPTRREAMQWVLAAVAASAGVGSGCSTGTRTPAPGSSTGPSPHANAGTQPAAPPAQGYGVDPNLVAFHKPGAFWPLTFTDAQRAAAAALADIIFPKDHLGPAATEVGVVEMVDEWISAPYPQQHADRPIVLEGLAWIDAESARRFSHPFAKLGDAHKRDICDDIAHAQPKADFRYAAAFFSRFRALCAGAYYSTPPGWEAIGYVGNVALPSFDGPPPEVLQKLDVTQTVQ